MERDNQKKKIISIEQAKNLIRRFWSRAAADGMSDVWVGDMIEEYRGGYLIPAMIVGKGESDPANYLRAWVDYTTGEVSMTFDLTA